MPKTELLFGFYELNRDMAGMAQQVTDAYPQEVTRDRLEQYLQEWAKAQGKPTPSGWYGRAKDFNRKPCFWDVTDVKPDSKIVRAGLHQAIRNLIASKNTNLFSKQEALAALELKEIGTNKYIYADTGQPWNGWPVTTPGLRKSVSLKAFQFKAGWRERPAATTATIAGQQLSVDLRHNEIQKSLYRHLVSRYGMNHVGTAVSTVTGAIDVAVRHGNKYWFFEIKTAPSSRECIQEALAQLLEYAFWPGTQEAERLIVVAEPPLDSESKEFLGRVRKRFSLPVEYQQFDMQKSGLLGPQGATVDLQGFGRNSQLAAIPTQSRSKGNILVTIPKRLILAAVLASTICLSFLMTQAQDPAQRSAADGPRYTNGTSLVRPTDYREWVFLGAGLGLTYEPSATSRPAPPFTNVFVNPSSYRSFMQTGKWPNATIFVLESRKSATDAPPNKDGRFQAAMLGMEAEVKDSRFPDGWGFFNFGSADALKDTADPLAGQDASTCVDCHTKNTAVERTFVQFYPTLLEVARQKGTLKPGF